jgi:hypothetical protein
MSNQDITANFHGGNRESHEAYLSVKEHAGALRLLVVRYVYRQNDHGATCDEIERALQLPHQTVSARVTEAKARGEIIPNGERRPTRSGRKAAVYVDPGMEDRLF